MFRKVIYDASVLYEFPQMCVKIIQITVKFLKLEACSHRYPGVPTEVLLLKCC